MENYNDPTPLGYGTPPLLDPDEDNVVYASGSLGIENPNLN